MFNKLGVSVSLNKGWQRWKKILPNFGGFDMNSSSFWFWDVICVTWLNCESLKVEQFLLFILS